MGSDPRVTPPTDDPTTATGVVLGADGADAFTGVVTAQRVGDGWRVADFFTTQTSSNPVGCEIE